MELYKLIPFELLKNLILSEEVLPELIVTNSAIYPDQRYPEG